jgi:glycosyltransferase involved in cell wall biosynthesis
MKLGVVVQRYGADISAGSELHARYIAEHLSRHADVRVLTTCARDHVTWRNELPAGEEIVNGIPVERFPVARERHLPEFTRTSSVVFERMHSWNDELAWLESEGPVCPALVARLERSRPEFDYFLFFTLRYYTACRGVLAAPDRAVLVPTAEREPSSGLALLQTALRSARAVMYNSPEERALLQAVSGNHAVPGDVVGVGSEIAGDIDPGRFRARFGIEDPFILYVGRIDENKGCRELFRAFTAFTHTSATTLRLLLIGTPAMDIPANARITHLGRVTDQEKFDALAAAEALVMPSPYESLSMVLLEAWAVDTPVLVNAQCDVLLGQCLRSRGGLYYANAANSTALA